MFPKLQDNKKLKKELASFEKGIKEISNLHVRNHANKLLIELRNEYELIDNSFTGTNGPVTPGVARESAIKSMDIRAKLHSLLKRR